MCSWYGVNCDSNGNVYNLTLSRNNLRGNISSLDFTSLQNLYSLDMSYNRIVGAVGLSLPSSLVILDLSSNVVIGQISFSSGSTSLRYLNVSNNRQSGYAQSSSSPTLFPNLISYDASGNFFYGGTLDLSSMTSLLYVNLSRNLWNIYNNVNGLPKFGLSNVIKTLDMSYNFLNTLPPFILRSLEVRYYDDLQSHLQRKNSDSL